MDLNQKNVVYVGAFGGIGSTTCKRLLEKNIANLAVLDVDEKKEIIQEFKALNPAANVFFLKVDLLDKTSIGKCIDAVIAKMGYIDVLVNGSGLFHEIQPEIAVGVNLLGLIETTMAVMPKMDKSNGNRGGTIVSIASVAGLQPSAYPAVYSASKAGVVMFARCLAEPINFNKTGVSFVTICPGITQTPLWDQFTSKNYTPKANELKEAMKRTRNQTPDDCAKSLVKAIEMNKNGAIYICDLGEINEVTIPRFWTPPL